MKMHNPPHPGEFITDTFLDPHGISGRELALKLDVAPSTLSRILKGTSRVTPEMALRLSKAIGRSAESWLTMQDAYDLWAPTRLKRACGIQRYGCQFPLCHLVPQK
ncbi:MAG: addiction module antidote protein, HigA family [Betaproteobacteria bacterium]|nr:addiction module antidote protein, HigA family [Betaproteobacteria bacterium]